MNYQVEGAYRSGATSGLIAGVTTGSATNGHIWAARWAIGTPLTDRRRLAVIQRLRVRGFTVAGYTGAQEVRLALFRLTGFTALHTGGTGAAALTPTPKRSDMPATLMTGRIAGSDQLTAGTHVIDTDPISAGVFAELAAAATVPKGAVEMFLSTEDLIQHPIILQANEGLLIRNEIAQGAGGSMRMVVEMDWLELERYPVGTYNVAKAVI